MIKGRDMQNKYLVLRCPYCKELNEINPEVPVQVCFKCGKKIVISRQERIIKNNCIIEQEIK